MLYRGSQPVRAEHLSFRPVLQHLADKPRRIRDLERHDVAPISLLTTSWILLLEPARDLLAERDLRPDGLIGAQEFLWIPNRLEQHLRPKVLRQQPSLENSLGAKAPEIPHSLAPCDHVPASRAFDDLMHVRDTTGRLAL